MTFTHGHFRNGVCSPTRNSWRAMIDRCHRANARGYHKYGARGITVCDRWRSSFEVFLEDMGPRPEGCTLDRYPDCKGNYEPENCRWATAKQQGNNKTDNHIVVVDGCEMTLAEAAARSGIAYHTLKSRIYRGTSVENALASPLRSADRSRLSETDIADIRRDYFASKGAKQVKPGTRQRLAEKYGVSTTLIHDLCRLTLRACA